MAYIRVVCGASFTNSLQPGQKALGEKWGSVFICGVNFFKVFDREKLEHSYQVRNFIRPLKLTHLRGIQGILSVSMENGKLI